MFMKRLQQLSRSLMQPISVLPVAALLMGIGYSLNSTAWGYDSFIASFFIQAGSSILNHLGLLFAIGVAYGLSRDQSGAAALSGMIGFLLVIALVSPETAAHFRGVPVESIPPSDGFSEIDHKNAFVGILSGIVAAFTYNRYHQVKLPDALSFFSGRRLTPIMTVFFMCIVSIFLFFLWPIAYRSLFFAGEYMAHLGAFGAGIYGFLNRLLIPTGLHHALNMVFWWDTIGIKDVSNFLSGQISTFPGVTTGMYQAGFFPIMMFGLPGAAFAMYQTSQNARKKTAASLLIAGSLAAFLTGVTEPLEFSFMFLAPGLYFVHALLTGLSMYIAAKMQWIAGFGFSAGLIDYLLSLRNPVATNVLMLIPLGLMFFLVYFFVFRFAILHFNLPTPGREEIIPQPASTKVSANQNLTAMASVILEGLGGKDNIDTIEYCITRLRIHVKDDERVDENKIRGTEISGLVRPSKSTIQVVIGPQVQFVYEEVKKQM